MKNLNIPVGISDFERIRELNYYYVDKTGLIKTLLQGEMDQVTLITRPRRFGKTMAMNMLNSFLDIRKDSRHLFKGLEISDEVEICEKWMNQYPTLFLSFKDVDGTTFENAFNFLKFIISEACKQHVYLLDSDEIDEGDKLVFQKLKTCSASMMEIQSCILRITNMLKSYYKKPVILLIDEYDVPIAKASSNGYYKEMLEIMKGLLSTALKDNSSLKFAVITGCLKIAKESIFTGTNNFVSDTISSTRYNEYYGFTQQDVDKLLADAEIEEKAELIKEWYDGYRFGKADVYCPWDVLNYCRDLLKDEQAQPKNYWLNTSGNDVIEHFIDSVNGQQTLTKIELERLISGEIVQKEINEFITYKELYNTSENLWSTLFMTGYLTQRGKADGNRYNLVIPNREVRNIITEHILVKFRQDIKKDGQMVQRFCQALANGQAQQVEQIFATYMSKTVSVRDTFVRKAIRENFYHGILLGILSFKDGWTVTSNRESGNGFSDILIQIDDSDIGIVIEVKYTEEGKSMESDCKAALKQIDEKNYTETLYQAGVKRILKYGIACQIKDCKVMLEE